MNNYDSVINELINNETSGSIAKRALKELTPDKKSGFVVYWVIITVSLIISTQVSFSQNTLLISQNIIKELLSVQLALFGCIFTVYSISLAFFSDNYLKRLSHIMDDNKANFLTSSIKYYESVLFLFFISICLSIIVMIYLMSLPENFRLFNNLKDVSIASFGLSIYLLITLRIIFEIKSTIYNTIKLFRVHIAYKFIDFKNDEIVEYKNIQK